MISEKEKKTKHSLAEKEDRDFLRSIGICIRCRKYTAKPGHTKCEVCLAENANYMSKKRASMSLEERRLIFQPYNEKRKQIKQERESKGLCIKCGKPNDSKTKTCLKCRINRREYVVRYKQSKLLEESAEDTE